MMSIPSRELRILIVDDNDDDIVLLREAFETMDGVTILAGITDGDEALRYLRREGPRATAPRPDLVLLDINMPGTNGFEVLEQVRADPALRDLPIVVLTTSSRQEDVSRSYASGACSFVTKPIDLAEMRRRLKGLVDYWSQVATIPR